VGTTTIFVSVLGEPKIAQHFLQKARKASPHWVAWWDGGGQFLASWVLVSFRTLFGIKNSQDSKGFGNIESRADRRVLEETEIAQRA